MFKIRYCLPFFSFLFTQTKAILFSPFQRLAVLLAIISSIRNRALPKGLVVFGEIGLAGEVRPAPRGQERLREAAKLGFSRAIIPRANKPKEPIEGLEVIPVDKLSEAVAAVQGME